MTQYYHGAEQYIVTIAMMLIVYDVQHMSPWQLRMSFSFGYYHRMLF